MITFNQLQKELVTLKTTLYCLYIMAVKNSMDVTGIYDINPVRADDDYAMLVELESLDFDSNRISTEIWAENLGLSSYLNILGDIKQLEVLLNKKIFKGDTLTPVRGEADPDRYTTTFKGVKHYIN